MRTKKFNFHDGLFASLLCGALLAVACSNEVSFDVESQSKTCFLTIKGITPSGDLSDERFDEVEVYQFSDGDLYRRSTVRPGQGGRAAIEALPGSQLYFLAGATLPVGEEGLSEEAFLRLPLGEGHEESAPDFLAAALSMDGAVEVRAAELSVAMKRGVARIDLDNSADSRMRLSEIVVEDAPAAALPFAEGTPATDRTVSYRRSFDPALSGVREDLFRLFESATPVVVTLRGTYDGVPVRLKVELPVVERNKIYEIAVLNVGSKLEALFEVKPWEEGGTVVGKPDTERRILLDAAHSFLPADVAADWANNVVEVPATGAGRMTLAFVGDAPVAIASTEGAEGGATIGEVKVEERPEGIVSTFEVSVAPQGSGRLGYSVLVHLKNVLLEGSYDYVEVRVAPSERQIMTVELGGSVWMAFNARSTDLEDQVYPLDGMTVGQMYERNWIATVGGLFQFGRRYMYVPWQGYRPSNNLGNQQQDVPWHSESHMPCPEGYRLPTRSELESLLPKGTAIPGTYTAGNGERIVATLHTGEGVLQTPTGVTGTQRYVKLAAAGSDRCLFIPLAGSKGDKSTSNNPGFGTRAVLWTDNRNGCPGGYAWAYWLPFEAEESTTVAERQLQMEAFASVRCVRK